MVAENRILQLDNLPHVSTLVTSKPIAELGNVAIRDDSLSFSLSIGHATEMYVQYTFDFGHNIVPQS